MDSPLDRIPTRELSAKRIYAYRLKVEELEDRIKVGETGRSVKRRVREQVNTAGLSDLVEILMDEPAVANDGRAFRDTDVHQQLRKNPDVTHLTDGGGVEWFKCNIEDVRSAYNSVVEGTTFARVRHMDFDLRDEQKWAIQQANEYFSEVASGSGAEPRFLWNAKMRFGKTFAAYHLAKRRNAKRVLVVTYKPAVQDSWETDLLTHKDFEGWEFFSRTSTSDPAGVDADTPLVCFSSLQDLRGLTTDGAIKVHNIWIHDTEWDMVIVDEYHYGAWNDATRQLLAGETGGGEAEYADARGEDDEAEAVKPLTERLGLVGREFLCLSGTPFRAIASNEFGPEQIFNWTYTDEQGAKEDFATINPGKWNPYGALPQMNLLVYQLPPPLRDVATRGTRNEFDLGEFFRASGTGANAVFEHKDQVQSWLDWLRGQDLSAVLQTLDHGTRKPFPYADTNLRSYTNHSIWFLQNVASVFAMKNLLEESYNTPFWGQYVVKAVAGNGTDVGNGAAALPPVREAIGNGFDTQTITLTCGKLLTGVTVPQWSSILMLNNLEAPESYFQAAFRIQSPWSIWNPEGDNPSEERVVKPVCLIIDFAPTRALRLFADYGMRLGDGADADHDVRELAKFLPVLGFDGTLMRPVDVDEIIDVAFENTSIDTRRMASKRFINASMSILNELSEDVRTALERVTRSQSRETAPSDEGETVINQTDELNDTSGGSGESDASSNSDEDEELQENDLEERLTFLSKRINAFMYLSDDIEKNLHDVLTTTEGDLFRSVMELQNDEMMALVDAGLFNEQAMRLAIRQFKSADVASFSYTGLNPRKTEGIGTAPVGERAEPLDAE